MSNTVTLLDLNTDDKHTAKVRNIDDAQQLIERVWPAKGNDEQQQEAVEEAAIAVMSHAHCNGQCNLSEHTRVWAAMQWLRLDIQSDTQ